jgi:predicted metal-dependent HD superfamily phosphohydrolase
MNYIRYAAEFCRNIYKDRWDSDLTYHNLTHTEEVVDHVQEIASFCKISVKDQEPLILAAWFHDICFNDNYNDHESFGAMKAYTFLHEYNYNLDQLEVVVNCINATKMPQSPSTIFEQIICDADLYHLGSIHFFEHKQLLREEWANNLNKTYSDLEWHHLNYDFLQKHEFHTIFGRTILEQGKQENLRKIELLIGSASN